MFTAHAAIELYAEAFESAGKLDRLEGFASHFGADFYGLGAPLRHDYLAQGNLDGAGRSTRSAAARLIPYRAGEPIGWRLAPP